ncbi:MAG TPA: copper resistance protein CopC [Gaiellaceae bacterium]
MKRAAVLFALLALAAPSAASAHATLLRTSPATGAVLARAPRSVRVFFDDTVRAGKHNAAVANRTGASVLAGKSRAAGRVLTIPLRPGLAQGDYSVRWSIVSDDGHPEEGVLAFAVGAGSAAPQSVLGAAAPLGWFDVVLRTLYYFGVLAGAGAAAFALLAWPILGERLRRPLAHLIFLALLSVFLGASGIVHGAVSGTRYDLVLKVALIVSVLGAAAAALAPLYRRLLPVCGACSVALVAAPTLAGHALDANQPRWLSVPVDLAHTGAASVWLGGLVGLVFALPRVAATEAERSRVAGRFSSVALIAVGLLAVTGLGRVLTELSAVSQVWSTSYGRALIVKTALFLPLLGAGWLNRTRLLGSFTRLRRSMLLEVTVLIGVVIVVAILTQLRPGTDVSERARATPQPATLVTLPGRAAVVDAHELGSTALAIARTPASATVTVLGPNNAGSSGLRVSIDGKRAVECGAGCYRGASVDGPVRVTVGRHTTTFDVPSRAPDATAELRQITKAYRASKTIVFDERLASAPGNAITTRFTIVAPNRLSYSMSTGEAAVVIGIQRWDRAARRAPFVESAQTPLDVTQPYWSDVSNVHEVAPGVLTFLDRELPAWFRLTLKRGPKPRLGNAGARPERLQMTAAAHFMVDRYVGFDKSVTVSPPASR